MQSTNEMLRVYEDWKTFYAPKNLLDNERTAQLLAEHVAGNHGGIVSFTALNAAVAALGPQVLKLEPTKAERDAKAAKDEFIRQLKNKPKSYEDVEDVKRRNAQDAQSTKKAAEAKQLADIKAEIAREINGYFVGHPSGGINYGRTEAGQTTLRKEAGNYNQLTGIDAAKTVLENVKAAKYRLP